MRQSDFLVVGSGIAGLIYALSVAKHGTVTVLCKSDPTEGSTRYAQGGIASVTSPLDSIQAHVQDTLKCGAGLCHQETVETIISAGPESIQRLIELGTQFDTLEQTQGFDLGKEGGHSARRVLHAGDATGAEIQRAVFENAKQHPNINILSGSIAIDLILSKETNEVLGTYVLEQQSGNIHSFGARTTLLATGGTGKVYLYTSNPDVSTGDGIAMAYRAGANIANMEFIQFHPTCLYHPEAKSFLITEAMRGEGAQLLNLEGGRFMPQYHSQAELAPRDIVARAIDDQMKKTGADHVLLDVSHLEKEFIINRFPNIYARTKDFGFDLTSEPLPVVPAAHYTCGGVKTDLSGKTNIHRLYAAGEVACTGLHGANRLASNSLLEALVIAERAAKDTIARLDELSVPKSIPEWDYLSTVKSSEEVFVSHTWDEVRRTMWNLVGIVRSDKRLLQAKRRIEMVQEEIKDYYWKYRVTSDLLELRSITTVAELIIRSALMRKESRGLHFTVDYPKTNSELSQADTLLKL